MWQSVIGRDGRKREGTDMGKSERERERKEARDMVTIQKDARLLQILYAGQDHVGKRNATFHYNLQEERERGNQNRGAGGMCLNNMQLNIWKNFGVKQTCVSRLQNNKKVNFVTTGTSPINFSYKPTPQCPHFKLKHRRKKARYVHIYTHTHT